MAAAAHLCEPVLSPSLSCFQATGFESQARRAHGPFLSLSPTRAAQREALGPDIDDPSGPLHQEREKRVPAQRRLCPAMGLRKLLLDLLSEFLNNRSRLLPDDDDDRSLAPGLLGLFLLLEDAVRPKWRAAVVLCSGLFGLWCACNISGARARLPTELFRLYYELLLFIWRCS